MSGEYLSPVLFPGAYISSDIGYRSSPGGIGSTNHEGIDIAAPYGTPVYAPVDLTITRAQMGSTGGYGNVIQGVDDNGNEYIFGHLSAIDVVNGATIAQGTTIGAVGSTGHSTGNHLHFGVLDSAGNVASDLAHKIVSTAFDKGKSVIKDGLNKLIGGAASTNPITSAIFQAGSVLGLNPLDDSCGVICQIQKWIEKTDFFKRVAFVVLGMILIVGAIVFFAKGDGAQIIKEAVNA